MPKNENVSFITERPIYLLLEICFFSQNFFNTSSKSPFTADFKDGVTKLNVQKIQYGFA